MTRALMIAARDELAPVLGPRPRVRLGFNLTADHFKNETIVEEVREVFAASPIRFSQVVLEVTEREPLENLDMARHVIAALQELGCNVAIDDVGTGHGGLSYMLKLGVNCIKIDKMFIDAIGTERYSTPIIETLVELANRMRMEIYAEGVETFDQVKYLRDRGIFLAQGYAFAPPLPGSLFRHSRVAGLLPCEHRAGAAEAGHDLVGDEMDAVAVGDLAREREIARRRTSPCRRALHQRLHDQRGRGRVMLREMRIERRGRGIDGSRRDPARHDCVDVEQRRIDVAKERDVGDGERAQRLAVIAAGEAHEARLSGSRDCARSGSSS